MLCSVFELKAFFSQLIEISMARATGCFALSLNYKLLSVYLLRYLGKDNSMLSFVFELQASFSLLIEISMARAMVCFALSLNYKLLSVYLLRYLWYGP
jgi:hypothetical protein